MGIVVFHCRNCRRETFRGEKPGLDVELKESWDAMCSRCTDGLEARYSRPAGLAPASTLGDEMIRADGILSAAMAEGYDKDFGLLSPGSATNRLAGINERVVAAVKRIGLPVVVWGPDRSDDESEGGYLMVRPDIAGSVEWTTCPHILLDWGPDVVSGFAFTPDGDPLPSTGLAATS